MISASETDDTQVDSKLLKKYKKLEELVRGYEKVGVAFSGGVDSSLLLFTCCQVLGPENVIGLQALSCLLSPDVIGDAAKTFTHCAGSNAQLHYVELFPLELDTFVANNPDRCYVCKKNVYSKLIEKMISKDGLYLLDGTNVDDIQGERPGLKAVEELQIKTPLRDCGLNKKEIRTLAKKLGLPNHALPSNSCLATRIPTRTKITYDRLIEVEKSEAILKKLGFFGCRARIVGNRVVIEIVENDFQRLALPQNRQIILKELRSQGFEIIQLNLIGRPG